MKIEAEIIPFAKMRYPTPGDYFEKPDGTWLFQIADTGRHSSNMMVLIHELVEWFLTQEKGIPEPTIAAFDVQWYKDQSNGMHGEFEEPGDHIDCPCRDEHSFATGVERLLCGYLGIPWEQYEEDVLNL